MAEKLEFRFDTESENAALHRSPRNSSTSERVDLLKSRLKVCRFLHLLKLFVYHVRIIPNSIHLSLTAYIKRIHTNQNKRF
jgi:hypothetical protein